MNKDVFVASSNISLQKFLLGKGFSFASIKKMLKGKDIKVNGARTSKDIMLCSGDSVECYYVEGTVSPKKVDVEIVYQDDNVLVVCKPKGIETCGEYGLEGVLGVIAVHRLDRNTAGLEIFAKSQKAKEELELVFKQKLVSKKYICEVVGDSNFDGRVYEAYLFKDAKKSQVIVSGEKKTGYTLIQTKFLTVRHGVKSSMVECQLITGKTHQIRAHLAYLGHAIVGDGKYGKNEINKAFKEKTQKLFCKELSFKEFDFESLKGISGKTFSHRPYWEENNG